MVVRSRPEAAEALVSPLLVASLVAAMSVGAAPVLAEDRVSLGGDVVVRVGEVVDSAVSFGGDVAIDGEVRGDVVSFGGDVALGPNAHVHGDVSTMGGTLARAPGALVDGSLALVGGADPRALGAHRWQHNPVPRVVAPPTEASWRHGGSEHHEREGVLARGVADMFESLVAHGLLFLLALVLSGLFPERMTALHKAIIREPMRSGALGVGSYAATVVLIVALAITVLGIPAAIVLAFGMPLATYVGLAACATVIGAALPSEALSGKPILRLAAGVGVLFVFSLVPFIGPILVAITACIGVGALVRTRFRTEAPRELELASQSVYR